jgi:magnesium-protoporphyrin O-methyltransferase
MSCCSTYAATAEENFTDQRATRDLTQYQRHGPGPTTRLLRDAIAQSGVANGLLLDIGSGVGPLTFELLDRGITQAIAVDASSAFIAAATTEAERRGRSSAIQFIHDDFLNAASRHPHATVVALDRVVCSNPLFEPLLTEALRHADHCFALSYPRDTWYVRAMFMFENIQRRLRRTSFRAYVHDVRAMQTIIENAGFKILTRHKTVVWTIDTYVRP